MKTSALGDAGALFIERACFGQGKAWFSISSLVKISMMSLLLFALNLEHKNKITQWLGDTVWILSSRGENNILLITPLIRKYFFYHSKIKSISSCHCMCNILYVPVYTDYNIFFAFTKNVPVDVQKIPLPGWLHPACIFMVMMSIWLLPFVGYCLLVNCVISHYHVQPYCIWVQITYYM